jgi:hypothetical protein
VGRGGRGLRPRRAGHQTDRLQKALPVLVLVLIGLKLGLRQLADEPLGERPLLVADLGLGALVDLGCVMDLVSEVEPLEEEPVLVHPDRDRRRLAAPGERANGDPARSLEGLRKDAIATLAILAGTQVVGVFERIYDERRRGYLLERLPSALPARSARTRPWRSRTLSLPGSPPPSLAWVPWALAPPPGTRCCSTNWRRRGALRLRGGKRPFPRIGTETPCTVLNERRPQIRVVAARGRLASNLLKIVRLRLIHVLKEALPDRAADGPGPPPC